MTDKTRVINIRSGQPYDVYIGRGGDPRTGNMSKWGNPFSHHTNSIARFHVDTREEAIASFREWIKTQPQLLAALPELKGRVLACWCVPKDGFNGKLVCHGQILAEMADALE